MSKGANRNEIDVEIRKVFNISEINPAGNFDFDFVEVDLRRCSLNRKVGDQSELTCRHRLSRRLQNANVPLKVTQFFTVFHAGF